MLVVVVVVGEVVVSVRVSDASFARGGPLTHPDLVVFGIGMANTVTAIRNENVILFGLVRDYFRAKFHKNVFPLDRLVSKE